MSQHIKCIPYCVSAMRGVILYIDDILYILLLLSSPCVLTRMPSQRDTALRGRRARNVRIERNAGMSAAPAHIAAKFVSDS
jgi:hypothetical protein